MYTAGRVMDKMCKLQAIHMKSNKSVPSLLFARQLMAGLVKGRNSNIRKSPVLSHNAFSHTAIMLSLPFTSTAPTFKFEQKQWAAHLGFAY